jgi:hypothetical protein
MPDTNGRQDTVRLLTNYARQVEALEARAGGGRAALERLIDDLRAAAWETPRQRSEAQALVFRVWRLSVRVERGPGRAGSPAA